MSGRFLLERDDGRSGAEVSGHRVQDLHGVLQLQLLVERHDARLGPVVSDQDPPQDPIVKLHKPERKKIESWQRKHLPLLAVDPKSYFMHLEKAN